MTVKAQKRISHLTDLDAGTIYSIINDDAVAAQWKMPVDHDVEGTELETLDEGTKKVPMSRIGLLSPDTRLVPQSFLPNSIDAVKLGDMNAAGDTFTTGETPAVVYKSSLPRNSGELVPSIGYVYADNTGTSDYQQYRYVPTDNEYIGTADETGTFVPIPSDLVLKDGEGTLVTDDSGTYTRKIDINIGSVDSPPAGNDKILDIQTQSGERKLIHTTSGVVAATYPASQTTAPGFGQTFNVPQFTVNSTGHVTSATTAVITIPDTVATDAVPGLVKINNVNANIKPIGSAASAGVPVKDSSNRYVLVAAADHIHTASKLTLDNVNDSSKSDESVSGRIAYAGYADKTYDFNNILKAILPTASPNAANQLLVSGTHSGGSGLTAFDTAWTTIEDVIIPEYVSTTVKADFTLNNAAATNSIAVSSGKITGLRKNKAYVVTYYFALNKSTAGINLDTLSVAVKNGNVVLGSTQQHNLDESLGTFDQYVYGTEIFVVPDVQDTGCTFNVTAPLGWTCTAGSVQIAEVK